MKVNNYYQSYWEACRAVTGLPQLFTLERLTDSTVIFNIDLGPDLSKVQPLHVAHHS